MHQPSFLVSYPLVAVVIRLILKNFGCPLKRIVKVQKQAKSLANASQKLTVDQIDNSIMFLYPEQRQELAKRYKEKYNDVLIHLPD
ncbi:hypothetical protein RH08_05275 [Candidatus Liberibacter asiaticus]|uniref:Uncharacterized protein n=2 Tax=Liberibacter asiaticus TaxID=34021 RepID=C6XH01_LIBAP|nr:hypothetical protein [Candidatus Liberibacter asiaticus]ACT57654.1 hypothetical protein CLIBASIA_05440 [Candidatus Liberibacter asiaticus str. psy62]AGH17414.1 hypothetical protein WSI_05285 [Candidatus Liberibacter asiaticus str. gxpsy]BAP26948.1 hypothetical protein CGUJ_05440 [Candidatus Liberibacter asiaticus str. Ishi-1]ALK07688.1 hypothetical protein CD16_05270 [Candidatus Liberibacter asiaticus]ASK53183.1 hypothetical protein B2I23_05350 [Candidatus Liberibacter asiaticus]